MAAWFDREGVSAKEPAEALTALSPDSVVTGEVLATLDAAARQASRRLEAAIQSVLDEGTHLRPGDAERLNALLDQIPVSESSMPRPGRW